MTIQIVRRRAMVMAGVALLCGLPVIASALPVSVPQLTADQLRTRILASADEPYAGYAESNATFGLPPVTGLTSLLNGVTRMRVWQATPARWWVDVLSGAGEVLVTLNAATVVQPYLPSVGAGPLAPVRWRRSVGAGPVAPVRWRRFPAATPGASMFLTNCRDWWYEPVSRAYGVDVPTVQLWLSLLATVRSLADAQANLSHSGAVRTIAFGLNVPFMQLQRHGWDIHAV